MHSQKDDTGTSVPKGLLPRVPRAQEGQMSPGVLASTHRVSAAPVLPEPTTGNTSRRCQLHWRAAV